MGNPIRSVEDLRGDVAIAGEGDLAASSQRFARASIHPMEGIRRMQRLQPEMRIAVGTPRVDLGPKGIASSSAWTARQIGRGRFANWEDLKPGPEPYFAPTSFERSDRAVSMIAGEASLCLGRNVHR